MYERGSKKCGKADGDKILALKRDIRKKKQELNSAGAHHTSTEKLNKLRSELSKLCLELWRYWGLYLNEGAAVESDGVIPLTHADLLKDMTDKDRATVKKGSSRSTAASSARRRGHRRTGSTDSSVSAASLLSSLAEGGKKAAVVQQFEISAEDMKQLGTLESAEAAQKAADEKQLQDLTEECQNKVTGVEASSQYAWQFVTGW